MKTRLLFLLSLMFIVCERNFAQIQSDSAKQEKDTIFQFFEVTSMAQFVGGQIEMFKYLDKNLSYPPGAIDYKIEGKVIVQFIVHSDGSISTVEIIGNKRLGWGLEEEAIRLISTSPQWEPAMRGTTKVPVLFRLPIKFELPE